MSRPLFMMLGWSCVGLGLLGIVMPLFPTTPFLLVAVWAFSRSSPQLAERIRSHHIAGPYVRDWEEAGVILPRAKILALAMMAAMYGYLHFGTGLPVWARALTASVLIATATFIITRPNRKPD